MVNRTWIWHANDTKHNLFEYHQCSQLASNLKTNIKNRVSQPHNFPVVGEVVKQLEIHGVYVNSFVSHVNIQGDVLLIWKEL